MKSNRIISIVRTPLPVAARLHRGGDLKEPVLLLDLSADPEDHISALLDALALVTVGEHALSARKVGPHRHLQVVPDPRRN